MTSNTITAALLVQEICGGTFTTVAAFLPQIKFLSCSFFYYSASVIFTPNLMCASLSLRNTRTKYGNSINMKRTLVRKVNCIKCVSIDISILPFRHVIEIVDLISRYFNTSFQKVTGRSALTYTRITVQKLKAETTLSLINWLLFFSA